MPAFDKAVIAGYLHAVDNATHHAHKGKAFEDLACYLLSLVPGVRKLTRNTKNTFATEEIDICCFQIPEPAGLMSLPHFFLVECKGWEAPVGSMEVNWFLTKIPGRGLDFGILIAANGITGNAEQLTAAHSVVAAALSRRIRMIVVTREEIEKLATSEQFADLIIEKVCELHASGWCY